MNPTRLHDTVAGAAEASPLNVAQGSGLDSPSTSAVHRANTCPHRVHKPLMQSLPRGRRVQPNCQAHAQTKALHLVESYKHTGISCKIRRQIREPPSDAGMSHSRGLKWRCRVTITTGGEEEQNTNTVEPQSLDFTVTGISILDSEKASQNATFKVPPATMLSSTDGHVPSKRLHLLHLPGWTALPCHRMETQPT